MQTETSLRVPKSIFFFAWSYVKSNGLYSIVGAYIVFSAMLYAFLAIDICIPCLWTTIFGMHCPGCGLTTAFINLLKLDPAAAWHANPLIFILLPTALFFIGRDLRKHQIAFKAAQLA